jgi:hypothetical protein
MKATLQIDVPESCARCPLKRNQCAPGFMQCSSDWRCCVTNCEVNNDTIRHPDCPLVIKEEGLRWIKKREGKVHRYYCPKCSGRGCYSNNYCPSCGVKLAPPLEGDDVQR